MGFVTFIFHFITFNLGKYDNSKEFCFNMSQYV